MFYSYDYVVTICVTIFVFPLLIARPCFLPEILIPFSNSCNCVGFVVIKDDVINVAYPTVS